MSPPTDDVSGVEDEDLIGVADRRDPLGDDEHRGVAVIGLEGGSEPGVGHVEGAEGIVKNVNVGILTKARAMDMLSLTTGDVGATLGDGTSNPFPSMWETKSSDCATRRAFQSSSSVASQRPSRRFDATVPPKR